jgi:hypothetical protein
MIKIITTRKEHKCGTCQKAIPKKSWAEYSEHKFGVFDENEKQIGIEFYKNYMCESCHIELTIIEKSANEDWFPY